jgi:hypothetical protein
MQSLEEPASGKRHVRHGISLPSRIFADQTTTTTKKKTTDNRKSAHSTILSLAGSDAGRLCSLLFDGIAERALIDRKSHHCS